ncbi:MAG: HAMP domain-containing protein [Gammaproteobacteria bacterium]|nr:HAMP domain-containing protein [Gammaproteobacteria bacterium]
MGSTQYGFGGSFESIDHIKGNTGEGWNIVIIREAKEVLSPIAETIYKFGVIGGLFALLAAFVAWFLGSRISRPIVQFAQSAKSLGAGNLDTTVDITSTDEIGDLAQSFNTMASNLKDTVISRDRLLTEVKDSLKEKEVLLQEIHHRVKNNMAVISSLLDLHMDQIQNQEAAAVLQDSRQRVRAMAMAHEELYRSKDLAHLKLSEYISNLVFSIEQLFGVVANRITIQTQLENLPVNMDQAIPLGLIINELVTNAMKHAFPEGRPGTITVSMESKEEAEIELMVADDGIGIPKELDWRNTDTMGLMIAVNLVQQIRGSIELDRSRGTCWEITFKEEAS